MTECRYTSTQQTDHGAAAQAVGPSMDNAGYEPLADPTKAVFFSPHNDDESLFGAFTLLRERPHVVVVLRSFVQEAQGVTYRQREAETAAAMEILGCTWEQWGFPDTAPYWDEIRPRMRDLFLRGVRNVWAPAQCATGHPQHNMVGKLVGHVWPQARFYTTYSLRPSRRQTTEHPIEHEPWMVDLKRRALDCYRSQLGLRWQRPHFVRSLEEYASTE